MKILFALLAAAFVPASAFAEIRGAWIASVHNINFPSDEGLSAELQKAQLVSLMDAAKRAGLNAVFLQVRPESDALYRSGIEPWSRYLTGAQGRDPGYDPLAFAISEGKKRGIAVHAWLNPYRAIASAGKTVAANHISRRFPQYAYRVGSVVWMDPGAPAVQAQILKVVADIASRYEVAGIHFDDYFYPYPTESGGLPNFPDDKTYAAYRSSGGELSKADWRRENVNSLIRRASKVVHESRPGALFGVSPFGIYTKGYPADVKAGVDQYNELFGDPVRWMKEGAVDYLAPQLYWRDGGPQSFSSLLAWWRGPQANPRQVPILPGIAVDRLNSHGWPAAEIAKQISLTRSIGPRAGVGYILWNIGAVKANSKGVVSALK